MLPVDSNNSFNIVSSILYRQTEICGDNPEVIIVQAHLEFILSLVDVDNEFISLLFEVRALESHNITVRIMINTTIMRCQVSIVWAYLRSWSSRPDFVTVKLMIVTLIQTSGR